MTAPRESSDDGARRRILARVRRALGTDSETPAQRAARSREFDAYLTGYQRGPAPALPAEPDALLHRFAERAQALLSTVERLPGLDVVPAAVAAYLDRIGEASRHPYASPSLQGLDWGGSGLAASDDTSARVSVTGCLFALAETGTLLLRTAPDTPSTPALLPEAHVVVLHRDQLLPTMEDAFARLRGAAPLPRGLHFISGPSRTADIDQTLVMGAHGPCRVHILVV